MAEIEFNQVTKTYRLGTASGLREALTNSMIRLIRKGGSENERKYFNAIDNVSFEVNQGEVLGIIGRNGAGKTTALKLLSRVTYPTKGDISVKGRISALIELGAGFHPDLSGAENIYLNGSILGLNTAEIQARFPEIVAFSGLEKFLSTPLKRYSSGMYARLAFSVAAHVDPDVLLVDEVLSVGDVLFQEKSLNKMKQFKKQGKTMVFISHNLVAVQDICSRVIWLEQGQIKAIGEPSEVIDRYLQDQNYEQQNILDLEEGEELYHYEEGDILVEAVKLFDGQGKQIETISGGTCVSVEIRYLAKRPIVSPKFKLSLSLQQYRITGSEYGGPNGSEQSFIVNGPGVITCTFGSTPVRPGPYHFGLDILEDDKIIYRRKGIGPLIVSPDKSASRLKDYNIFNTSCDWQMRNNI